MCQLIVLFRFIPNFNANAPFVPISIFRSACVLVCYTKQNENVLFVPFLIVTVCPRSFFFISYNPDQVLMSKNLLKEKKELSNLIKNEQK